MKFSALLSILTLGIALALIAWPASEPRGSMERSAESPENRTENSNTAKDSPSSSPAPSSPSEDPPSFIPGAGEIRYLGHDWVEVIEAEDSSKNRSPFTLESPPGWNHPAHRAAAACRVCELIRVMNGAW